MPIISAEWVRNFAEAEDNNASIKIRRLIAIY
jgi:hypothetical protein